MASENLFFCAPLPMFPLTMFWSLGRNTRPTPGSLFSSPQSLSSQGKCPSILPRPQGRGLLQFCSTSSVLITIAEINSKVRRIPSPQAHLCREYHHPHVPSSAGNTVSLWPRSTRDIITTYSQLCGGCHHPTLRSEGHCSPIPLSSC